MPQTERGPTDARREKAQRDALYQNVLVMALQSGNQTLGPDRGGCRVHTCREGMAQKAGHNLILEVG